MIPFLAYKKTENWNWEILQREGLLPLRLVCVRLLYSEMFFCWVQSYLKGLWRNETEWLKFTEQLLKR